MGAAGAPAPTSTTSSRPTPRTACPLEGLRALAVEWARESFPNHEVAIVYHDDNANGIPHAHVVVNNTDLETGRRLQDPDPKALARSLQRIAEDSACRRLSRAPPPASPPARSAGTGGPRRGRIATSTSRRAEKELAGRGEYSWVADIRARVRVARSVLPQRRRVQKPPLVHGGGGFRQLAQSREEGLGLFPRRDAFPARWAGKGSVCRTAGAGSSRCCARRHGAPVGRRREGVAAAARAAVEVGDLAELRRSPRRSRSRSRRARACLDDTGRRGEERARGRPRFLREAHRHAPRERPPPVWRGASPKAPQRNRAVRAQRDDAAPVARSRDGRERGAREMIVKAYYAGGAHRRLRHRPPRRRRAAARQPARKLQRSISPTSPATACG